MNLKDAEPLAVRHALLAQTDNALLETVPYRVKF